MRWFCDCDYLLFPVSPSAERVALSIESDTVDGIKLDIRLTEPEKALYFAPYDVRRYRGTELRIVSPVPYQPSGTDKPLSYSDFPHSERPAVHLTAPYGWLNDPNGLIFYGGKFHIFFQFNPVGTDWGNMHWYHLATEDFCTYEDHGIALFPNRNGTKYSGSAFELPDGSLGLYYTAAGGPLYSQHLAISTNGAESFFDDPTAPPLVPYAFARTRDPKVERDPAGGYVMSLFLDEPDLYAIYRSEDLVSWRETDRFHFDVDRECPGFFPLPLDGNAEDQRWIMMGANGIYRVGSLADGRFIPETEPRRLLSGALYAGQNFFAPDGRCLRLDWLRRRDQTVLPDTPWNSSLTFPYELSLVTEDGIPSLSATPSRELLRRAGEERRFSLAEGEMLLAEGKAYLLRFSIDGASDMLISLRGAKLKYSADAGTLTFGRDEAQIKRGKPIEILAVLDTDGVDLFVDGKKTAVAVDRSGGIFFEGKGMLSGSYAPLSETVYENKR